MKPKAAIRGLPVYEPGKTLEEVKRELGLDEVIKLASNENPFGCSPKVVESLSAEFSSLTFYPEGTAPKLRKALSERLKVDPEGIILGNGSDEIIQMISRAYLERDDEVVMADKTFPRYKTQALIEGARPVEVPLQNGVHDLPGMLRRVTPRTKILWICNPNNPTGTIIDRASLIALLEDLPDHVLVVIDEAYAEYVTDPDYPDSIGLLEKYPRLVVLRTFSKIYGLASLRIGYGLTHPDIVRELDRVREPFNVNRLAQRAALAALEDDSFVRDCREQNRKEIEKICRRLEEWNLFYYPPHGNFILLDTGRPADEVFQFLLHRGVIVRSGTALGYPTFIRVTVGTPEQNQRFLDALAEFVVKREANHP